MKFELERLQEYTDDALLSELRRVADLVGSRKLTISEFSKHSKIGITTLRRRFGSWPKALVNAGLAHLYNPVAPASKSRVLARSLSNEEILDEIRRIAQLTGRTELTADDLRQHAIVGVDAIRNRFGTLKSALRTAGVLETSHGRRYSEEECYENLLKVWTYYGRPPQYQEMKLSPSTVGPKAYIIRWKRWNRALKAFVDRINRDDDGLSAEIPASPTPADLAEVPKELSEEDHHKIKLGLRYKVLVRDRFKCILCGSSPATDLTCRLHVDHIIPWSKGGKTVIENLRTLCEFCNLGKGNQHEHRDA